MVEWDLPLHCVGVTLFSFPLFSSPCIPNPAPYPVHRPAMVEQARRFPKKLSSAGCGSSLSTPQSSLRV